MLFTLAAFAFFASPQNVAILQDGARYECVDSAVQGDLQVLTPYGVLHCAQNPVVDVIDASAEVKQLERLCELDEVAWMTRIRERGLLTTLTTTTPTIENRPFWLNSLAEVGRGLDPLPQKTPQKKRLEKLWSAFRKAAPGPAALLLGRVSFTSQGAQARPPHRITLSDLLRAYKKDDVRRWGVFRIAERQLEHDLLAELLNASTQDAFAHTRNAAAQASMAIDSDLAQGHWAYHLFGGRSGERQFSASHLGQFGHPQEALAPLMAALAASQIKTRGTGTPRGSAFFGTQVSVVSDFSVSVAQAAVIARPRVSVIMSGNAIDVRILGTTTVSAITTALSQLTSQKFGTKAEDWLAWYAKS